MRINLAVGELSLATATARLARGVATDGASFLAGLSRVNFAVRELGLLRALVRLSVFAETAVFGRLVLIGHVVRFSGRFSKSSVVEVVLFLGVLVWSWLVL